VAEQRDPAVVADLDTVRDELHHAIAQLRDLAHGVYPAALTEAGLAAALRHTVARFPGDATVDLRTARRFDPDVESAAYFCCTEALNNALKHGGETARVQLTLDADDSELRFAIWDDGRGFDPAAPTAGVGFENMADRLGAVGGQLHISSSIGSGTRVVGIVPVRKIKMSSGRGRRDGRCVWAGSPTLPDSIAAI
jgi:signal transduction histidine kinase